MCAPRWLPILGLSAFLLLQSLDVAAAESVTIGNAHVRRTLQKVGGAWRTVEFSRADGSNALKVESDEFSALFFDDKVVTVADYESPEQPRVVTEGGVRKLVVKYVLRKDVPVPEEAPTEVTITFSAGDGCFMHKSIDLVVPEKFMKQIDRLEVERFSTAAKGTRGGRGQPVFLGDDWFAGIEHPSGRSRHTDGNTPADNAEYGRDQWGKRLSWLSNHSAEGRDIDQHPRSGLVRLMHFPPYPKLEADGAYHLKSKAAVIGTHTPGDTLELGFLDYMKTISLKPQRLSHYNNWYDAKNKDLSVSNFVDKVLAGYTQHFSDYGVAVDSMVPDNFNWHVSDSFYAPNPRYFPNGDADMRKLNHALRAKGSNLGVWLTLSGNNGMSAKWAREHGYQWGPGGHFLLSNPTNRAAMKKRLKELLVDVGMNYFKHDFNTLSSTAENGHAPDARHGHEAEVDGMFEILDWEVECNPEVFINITSSCWFSPWLLAKCHSIWLLSHDDGAGMSGPEPSNFSLQQSYRDEVIHGAWGDPATRPLIPVSQLMTHGIICAPHCVPRGYNNVKRDSIQGWADGVMMYYMRGTLLQEWYITPDDLTQAQWDALGRTSRWFQENQHILMNSVMWGGDPAVAEPCGYAAWDGERGIISMRNSQPVPRTVSIPFDKTVWFRGKPGVSYKADVVFPWHNEWPETLISGRPIEVTVPPFSVVVMQLAPGRSQKQSPGIAEPIAVKPEVETKDGLFQRATFEVPARQMGNCELMVTVLSPKQPDVRIDGKPVTSSRESWSTSWSGTTDKWRSRCYDLLLYRGRTISVEIEVERLFGKDIACSLYMIQDQTVAEPADTGDVRLPLPTSQGMRRAVALVCENTLLRRGLSMSAHPVLGIWYYEAGGNTYTREFTTDGKCILRQGDSTIWEKSATVKNDRTIEVAGAGGATIKSDGTLDIEGRYVGRKRDHETKN